MTGTAARVRATAHPTPSGRVHVTPRPRGEANVDLVIAAARTCIAEQGIGETTMEHIAQHARISRPHLYTFVSSRAELLELVALARLGELGEQLGQRARSLDGDIGEAIVDQIVATTALGRSDPEFIALAEVIPRFGLNILLTSRSSPLHEINSRVFGPLLARAMADGRLRSDVPVDAIIEWLQGVLALLAGRDDLDDAEQRTMVRRFVVPGLLRS